MADAIPAAGTPAADRFARVGRAGGGWSAQPTSARSNASAWRIGAKGTDATVQLLRCFPSWTRALEQLTLRTLERLAANEPVDPNDPDGWRSRDAHAQAVLHRHGEGKLSATRLTSAAITALIDGQASADRDAGLDWSTVTTPASALDERLARAHATLPVDLDDPRVWAYHLDQRRVLARPLGLDDHLADDLSRWLLANPSQFDAGDLRCWRIGSDTWLSLAGERLGAVGKVERPVGVFVVPAIGSSDGWQLTPVLALDTIRLVAELGGRLERDLRSAVIPIASRDALLERINVHTLHAGPRECLDSAGQLAQELSRELGVPVSPGVPRDKRDRWGRLAVHRRSYKGADGASTAELELRVLTFPARGFTQRRLGSAPREEQYARPSAVMDLGEAVQTAVDAGLPLLLSTEAAGQLKDTVRVGRMKGRPGMLTITTSDGVSATTRRLVAEQAIGELRALKRAQAKVTLAAGARQVVRMTLARPLADDPVLLGRQREMAALKVVGSGVDASAVGTGKTISSGRALAHRASTQPRFRGLVVAEGRLLGQWREELAHGAPGRGLPPLAPNLELLVLADDRQIAGQIRRFDRELGDRRGRGTGAQQRARPLPGRPAGDPVASADRRRGASLREPRDRGAPGARPAPVRIGRRLLALDRDAARKERRAPRRARRPRGRGRGDDHRAAQHPRGRRPDGRDQRPPAAGQLRPAPRARHPPRHAGVDARGPARGAARARPRPRAVRAARRDPPRRPGGVPAAARGAARAQVARGGQRDLQARARRARPRPRSRARQRRRVRRRERRPGDADPLEGRARDRARPSGARRRGDPWGRRRAAAAARRHGPDAGRGGR